MALQFLFSADLSETLHIQRDFLIEKMLQDYSYSPSWKINQQKNLCKVGKEVCFEFPSKTDQTFSQMVLCTYQVSS